MCENESYPQGEHVATSGIHRTHHRGNTWYKGIEQPQNSTDDEPGVIIRKQKKG